VHGKPDILTAIRMPDGQLDKRNGRSRALQVRVADVHWRFKPSAGQRTSAADLARLHRPLGTFEPPTIQPTTPIHSHPPSQEDASSLMALISGCIGR